MQYFPISLYLSIDEVFVCVAAGVAAAAHVAAHQTDPEVGRGLAVGAHLVHGHLRRLHVPADRAGRVLPLRQAHRVELNICSTYTQVTQA